MATVYKVLFNHELADLVGTGRFVGSADDRRDGFIHLSTYEQISGTLAKHFPGTEPVWAVAVDAQALGDALRWEPSRAGGLFPHLYGALDVAAVQMAIYLCSSRNTDALNVKWA